MSGRSGANLSELDVRLRTAVPAAYRPHLHWHATGDTKARCIHPPPLVHALEVEVESRAQHVLHARLSAVDDGVRLFNAVKERRIIFILASTRKRRRVEKL